MDERTSVRLIEALSRVWTKIRIRHPDVPPVVLLAAPAPRGEHRVLGHFAALRWSGKKSGDDHLHEVVVVAEHLNRSPEEIAETLLHESAHAMNFARGIKDCSASQYHNGKFKEAAEEIGLRVLRVPHYGYALTVLPKETAEHYQGEIDGLKEVLIHRRSPATLPAGPTPAGGDAEGQDGGDADDKPHSRLRKAQCPCGFIIRVSMKTITDTTIRCESCGEPFRLA